MFDKRLPRVLLLFPLETMDRSTTLVLVLVITDGQPTVWRFLVLALLKTKNILVLFLTTQELRAGKRARKSRQALGDSAWRRAHQKFPDDAGIEEVAVEMLPGVANEREQHLVACVRATNPGPSLIIDASQSLLRKAFGQVWPTLTTSSSLYGVSEARAVLPREHFFILGFPRSTSFQGLSSSQVRNLAGEAIAPPAAAFVSYGMMLRMHDLWADGPCKGES